MQEVLAEVLRRMRDFQHSQRTGAFRAWLRTITVNNVRDFLKAKRIRSTAPLILPLHFPFALRPPIAIPPYVTGPGLHPPARSESPAARPFPQSEPHTETVQSLRGFTWPWMLPRKNEDHSNLSKLDLVPTFAIRDADFVHFVAEMNAVEKE